MRARCGRLHRVHEAVDPPNSAREPRPRPNPNKGTITNGRVRGQAGQSARHAALMLDLSATSARPHLGIKNRKQYLRPRRQALHSTTATGSRRQLARRSFPIAQS